MSRVRTLLVAVDFSDHSRVALDWALDLARDLGAKVHVIHAYAIPTTAAMSYGVALPEGLWERVREAADQRLAEVLERVRGAGLAGESHLVESSPADAISDTAQSIGADLIVMGTRGLSGLKHVLLGSVAERTLRIAPCPVLTVKTENP